MPLKCHQLITFNAESSRVIKHVSYRTRYTHISAILPKAALTSEAVRFTLLVNASTISIEPLGPKPS